MIAPDKGTPIGLNEASDLTNPVDKGTPIGLKGENAEGDAVAEDDEAESPQNEPQG